MEEEDGGGNQVKGKGAWLEEEEEQEEGEKQGNHCTGQESWNPKHPAR
jgi:hypothetical protein